MTIKTFNKVTLAKIIYANQQSIWYKLHDMKKYANVQCEW